MSLFGWTLCAIGIFALLVLLITSGDIKDWLDGAGGRRITRRGQLAHHRKEIAKLKAQIEACPACTPPDLPFPTVEEIADADALAGPGTHVPAPIDAGCRDTPLANAETQATDVTALRNAMGMGRTAVFPVVAVPPPQQIPAGPGSTDPTEVSPATGQRAVVSVDTALNEAS